MTQLPAGTLTFLFTDIEGSTRLWESDPDWMRSALARHDQAIEHAVSASGGTIFKHTGDGLCAVFASAPRAIEAAVAAQRALAEGDLRARMGIHTGHADPVGEDYLGTPLNRCARIMGAAHGGQIVCSATTASVSQDLPDIELRDLGAHRLRDLGEAQQLFQVLHPDLPDSFPPLRALDAHRHNLPVPRTSFVGRERELDELKGALAVSRILTVTGAGGSGKTRLALHAAAEVVDRFEDGVYLAELAATTDATELPVRVAQSVGVPSSTMTSSSSPRDVLIRSLADKELLLILDNCEHLLDACAELIDDLLSVSERLTVVATSREPLGVAGERVLRIPSLGVSEDESSVEAVLLSEAGQLLHDRATMARAGFSVNQGNVQAVAQICRRLDGIPLAIELAAARLRHLSVQQLADRLDDRFRILTGGGRTALPRQQTLQATLDWSHDLLTDVERTLFRRLAVFVGSFTLDAVEGVCSGDGIDEVDVIDVLGRLVDRSLVVLDDTGPESLYGLFETMRHFAQQKLTESGEAEQLRDRHREWFAAQVDVRLMPFEQYGVLHVPPHAQENVRAAFEWAMATGADDAAHRLVIQVALAWMTRGLIDEASIALDDVRARPWSASVVEERAWVLIGAAAYANLRNEFATGFVLAEEAEAFIAEHSLAQLEPHVSATKSIAAAVARGMPLAEELMDRAATSAATLGLQKVAAETWVRLAGMRLPHDAEGGRQAAVNGVAASGDDSFHVTGVALATSAFAHLLTGDDRGAAEAMRRLDRILVTQQFDAWAELEGILPRSCVLGALGRVPEANAEVRVALEAVQRFGVPLTENAYLVGYASIEAFGGDPERALLLLAAARRRFAEEGAWRAPIVGALYVHSTARARSLVPNDVAEAAREAGRSLSGHEALALVT